MSQYDEYQEYTDRKAAGGGQRKHAAGSSSGKHAKAGGSSGGSDGDSCMVVAPIPAIGLGLLCLAAHTLVRQSGRRARA